MEDSLSGRWQDEEHPNVQSNDQNDLENDFAKHVLPQIESSIDDDEEELNNQHKQERDRNFVFGKVAEHAAVAFLRSKGRKAEQDDEKVEEITNEEESVDVSGLARLAVEKLPDKFLSCRHVLLVGDFSELDVVDWSTFFLRDFNFDSIALIVNAN